MKKLILFSTTLFLPALMAAAPLVNQDGPAYWPSLELQGWYQAPDSFNLPNAAVKQGKQSYLFSVNRATYPWGGTASLRLPLTPFLSLLLNTSGSDTLMLDQLTGLSIQASSQRNNSLVTNTTSLGLRLFSGALVQHNAEFAWGPHAGPYGYYWFPNLTLLFGVTNTWWQGGFTYQDGSTQQTNNFTSFLLVWPLPGDFFVAASLAGNLFDSNYPFSAQNGLGVEAPLALSPRPSQPDFKSNANPDGWAWLPYLSLWHYGDDTSLGVEEADLKLPLAAWGSALLNYQYRHSAQVDDSRFYLGLRLFSNGIWE